MDCYDGMKVNERLYHLGLMDEFYKFINQGNEEAAIDVLTQAKFNIEEAKVTVHEILKNL